MTLCCLSLSLTACLDEHPKDQVPEKEIYDSASSLYVNAVASLYNYIGAHEEGEGLQGTCRGIYDYNTFTTTAGQHLTPNCITYGNIYIR